MFREISKDGKTLWWKIPNRDILCDTFSSWISELFYIYILLKIFKKKRNYQSHME